MSPHRWRMAWVVAVGLSQVALTAAAVRLFILPTQIRLDFLSLRIAVGSGDLPPRAGDGPIMRRGWMAYYYGHPIPWAECHQVTATSWESVGGQLDEPREVYRGPEVVEGWNPALPPVLILTAVSLPPVAAFLAARLARRIRRRTAPVPFSRPARLWCVVWFASAAALTVAWMEAETTGFLIVTPLPDRQPPPWADEVRAAYGKAVERAERGRWWLDARLPGGMFATDWPSRTRLTGAAFLSGVAVGGLLFRPWRRGRP
jgi:hypothetical protein